MVSINYIYTLSLLWDVTQTIKFVNVSFYLIYYPFKFVFIILICGPKYYPVFLLTTTENLLKRYKFFSPKIKYII